MLFEALTASALGWWAGMALVVLLPLALASLALLAPVALEEGRLPAGFNPDQWRSLGLLATSQQAPWSLALMGAQRLSMLFGGATAIFLTGVLYYVGYAGRLDLHRQLGSVRQGSQQYQQRVDELGRQIELLRLERDTAQREATNERQRAARCEQQAVANTGEHRTDMRRLEDRLAQESARRDSAENALRDERDTAARVVERFNGHLRDLNRQIVEQCPTITPLPRPGSLPEDPDAPRPTAPPFGQRPPARPPFR